MKRVIKLTDGLIFIFFFTIGGAIYTNFSNTTANDVIQAGYFMLFGFLAIFFIFGEKVRGGE